MESANKSFELQAQVRHNAEEIKNAFNDLYNWQKEIKEKEKDMLQQQEQKVKEAMTSSSVPVRSHIKQQDSVVKENLTNGFVKAEAITSPMAEKQDTPYDPLELKHKEANEFKDRGNKYVKLGKHQLAIEEYTQAIQLYPEDAIYYNNRALCYLRLERYDECIEDCDRAIEIDSLAVKAYYRRMMANESLGNNMDALKDCTTVLTIEPKNSEAKRSLERINERLLKLTKTTSGPNFNTVSPNMVDILPIDKPAYKRSTKPLKRITITDVVGPKDNKNQETLKMSDEDIDKLFNSNCGYFEEIKTNTNLTKANNSLETKQNKIEGTKTANIVKTNITEDTSATPTTTTPTSTVTTTATTTTLPYKTERPLPPAPTSTAQFYSNWKELTPEQKYQYLKSIPQKYLCKILGAGFDSDTLSDIISTLHKYYLTHKDADTASTLLEVSKNKQLSILSLLMSNEERKALSEIINSLKENNSLDATSSLQIMKNFNLN